MNDNIAGCSVWINLQTGQQVKCQTFHRLADGTDQVLFTQRYLIVEKVMAPPQEVLNILERVVVP